MDLLKRPELDYAGLLDTLGMDSAPVAVAEQVEILAKYAGYIDRQADEIARVRNSENTALPDGFDYAVVKGLSNELRQKLETVRPATIGQASRIPGMTPAAISLLLVYLKKHRSAARARA